ncbi:hypothetical protein ACH4PW_17600 [Streptomyces sp. NPDC017082]|uniref:hypothetical protein n=1 Tax=Streptomyces sp. NPDC017082 TaxID=3364974 RepID=UPI0037997970
MARLSFEKKRPRQPVGHPAALPVRVFGGGGASVDGVPVVAAPGEEIQQAVLNHLQRLAISLGAPIRATVHDDVAGCVVPLEVSADGSSRMTGEPVRLTAPETAQTTTPGTGQAPAGRFGPPPVMDPPATPSPAPQTPAAAPGRQASAVSFPQAPAAPSPAAVPGPRATLTGPGPHTTTAAPAPLAGADADASAKAETAARAGTGAEVGGDADLWAAVTAVPEEPPAPGHTPARGFDAVAEEVLGDGPLTETAEGAELLAEPLGRINEAVRAGRIDAAAELADRTLAEASAVFGPTHAEVLHVRELTAYIAYLADDPVRACRLSLDLARLRRQARDGEAAYGNVRSAATAWRAVRDPEEGLRLGRDLVGLWTDLAAEPGPAADDPRPLEAARTRMVRLADRAAAARS